MTTLAVETSKYLKELLDDNDPFFKIVIGDKDATPPNTINTPNDYDIGMVSNFLEWNRQLTISLLKQLVITSAKGKFLDFILHTHCNIVRLQNELDIDYVDRAISYIIGQKVSPASIVHYTKKFSNPGIPKIYEGALDSAFADVCFASYYDKFRVDDIDSPYYLWNFVPAITRSVASSIYFFVLELQNLQTSQIPELLDTVNRWRASGISYEIRVVYV